MRQYAMFLNDVFSQEKIRAGVRYFKTLQKPVQDELQAKWDDQEWLEEYLQTNGFSRDQRLKLVSALREVTDYARHCGVSAWALKPTAKTVAEISVPVRPFEKSDPDGPVRGTLPVEAREF